MFDFVDGMGQQGSEEEFAEEIFMNNEKNDDERNFSNEENFIDEESFVEPKDCVDEQDIFADVEEDFIDSEKILSFSSEAFNEIFNSFNVPLSLPTSLDYYGLTLSDGFKEFLADNVSDINEILDIDYWHIANILVLFIADCDYGVHEMMETVLENNNIECQIHLSDTSPVFSLGFVFNIFNEDDNKYIHITTSKTNFVNNALYLNQLYDVTNVWNSLNFVPTASIQNYGDNEYVVRTKQVLNITNGASINQLYGWIDSAINVAFTAQKEIASSYIDL